MVCAVLVVAASLIVPRVVGYAAAERDREAAPSVLRLVAYARETAIAKGTTMVLSCDSASNSLTAKADDVVDSNAPTASALTANPTSIAAPDPSQGPNRTYQAPTGFQFTDFRLGTQTSNASDWQLRFYSDGTCDGGGLGFAVGTSQSNVEIDVRGDATLQDGTLGDGTNQSWEAGQFEPRQGV